MFSLRSGLLIGLAILLLGACSPTNFPDTSAAVAQTSASVPTLFPNATSLPTSTQLPTVAPQPTHTPSPTVTSQPTATLSPTATFVPLSPTPTLAPLSEGQREDVFNQVWQLVHDRYVYADYRGLDWDAVKAEFEPRVIAATSPQEFYRLMHELIERLGDNHSRFISPQEVIEEQTRFEGELNYVGIGISVRMVGEGGLITQVAHDGPAEQAGLQPHDLVLAVNGMPLNVPSIFPDGPMSAVRGSPGTSVRLRVRSPGHIAREVVVMRRAIAGDAFPSVEARRLPGSQVGLLTIGTFNRDGLDQLVRQHLHNLLETGPLDGLIIDVRDNGGGHVQLMLDTLALLVDGGSIGSSSGRIQNDPLTIPSGAMLPQLAHVPIEVLINSDTASAAEMFAAGLQALGRARIVGTNSAGNTENLLPHNFSDGSQLWLAELAYRLPDGSLIEGRGVHPDRIVAVQWERADSDIDPQIQAALDELHQSATLKK